MAEFRFIGIGDKQSQKELWNAIDKYKEKFDTSNAGAPLILVDLLKDERQKNEYLISVYNQAIEEGKTVDKIIKYDREYREDVLY